MTEEQIDRLREKYLPLGIVWGGEFLLPPNEAIRLLREFAEMGVVVVACDLWRYVDRSKGWIVSLLGAGHGVGNDRVASVTAEGGAAVVEDFLVNHLPPDAELVSFLYRDVDANDWFAGRRQSG